jgi:hypothetical protein
VPILQVKVEGFESLWRLEAPRRFAASPERSDVQQLQLFNEAEAEAAPALAPATETITVERKKKVPGQRNAHRAHLPVERRLYELSEAEQSCTVCHNPLPVMSAEVRRELEVIPAPMVNLSDAIVTDGHANGSDTMDGLTRTETVINGLCPIHTSRLLRSVNPLLMKSRGLEQRQHAFGVPAIWRMARFRLGFLCGAYAGRALFCIPRLN